MPRPRHLYVHVPFCARRCSYCDFSIAVRATVPVRDYVRGIRQELAVRYPAGEPWTLDTLYFGGGTPSRLGAAGVAELTAAIGDVATLAPGAEVTLETNPDDVSDQSVARWREAGINRLSLGAQTFSDEALRWMHRTHDAGGIVQAIETIRRGGIENFSFDLIFALPDAVPRSWRDDLARVLDLAPPHVSLYGLTVEQGTPLARWRDRGQVTEAGEDRYGNEFLAAHDALTGAGYEHYEVSNFALPGLRSRHNSSYWMGAPYAGIGPAAHEFDGLRRRWNVGPYAEWLRRVTAGQDPREDEEQLTDENRVAEAVYLGLRTDRGLALIHEDAPRVARWIDAGWAWVAQGRLMLTTEGWLRLDSLAADLTESRSRY